MKAVCPNCHQKYDFTKDDIEKEVKCNECKRSFLVTKAKFCSGCGIANSVQAFYCHACRHPFQFSETDADQEAAEQGDADAQYKQGLLYYEKASINNNKAFDLFTKSAKQGHAQSQGYLAAMYYKGECTSQNYDKAVHWWLKAAKQGNADAQDMLGWMYSSGSGVTSNYERAFDWYSKAAEQGSTNALYNQGRMYWSGEGVSQDSKKALDLLMNAAKQGNVDAQFMLGAIYKLDDLADLVEGLEKDDKKALEWYEKAAEQGYEGSVWLENEAEQGDAAAQASTGLRYMSGNPEDYDYEKAVYWLKKAAEQENAAGQFFLGWLYERGDGVEQDHKKAHELYQKAAKNGHIGAMKTIKQKEQEPYSPDLL
ncbi:MAG: hypothetical protein PHS31_02120 [Victivallaceae bacterium]|nr:hypothetical protein [Victivallaceae bacterium]